MDNGERPVLCEARFVPAPARGRGLRVGRWLPRDSEGFICLLSLSSKRLSRIFFDQNSLRGTDPGDFMLDRKSEQENLKKKKKRRVFLPSFSFKPNGEPFWKYWRFVDVDRSRDHVLCIINFPFQETGFSKLITLLFILLLSESENMRVKQHLDDIQDDLKE